MYFPVFCASKERLQTKQLGVRGLGSGLTATLIENLAIRWIAIKIVIFFSFQIISQKDEHCWVGELNGLRGEANGRAIIQTE